MNVPPADIAPRIDSLNALEHQLSHEGLPFQRNDDGKTLSVPTILGTEQGVVHIRWETTPGLLQFVHPMPVTIAPTDYAQALSTLNAANHGLAVLGFTLNEETGGVVFRSQAYLDEQGGITPGMIGAMIKTATESVLGLLPTIRRIVE